MSCTDSIRIHITTNQFYTETNIQNTGFSTENTFVDSGLNTLRNIYTYKIQALDICGNTIPLDQLTAHTTINVSSQRQGQGYTCVMDTLFRLPCEQL